MEQAMKREIKFRVWDGEQMWYPETKTVDGNSTYISFFNDEKSIGWGLYDLRIGNRLASGSYDEIMEFTGEHTRGGKDIYEGDIVDFIYDDLSLRGAVKYEYGSFCIDYEDYSPPLLLGDACVIDVVGNIYENPELIKANQHE